MKSDVLIFKTKTSYGRFTIARSTDYVELRSASDALQSLINISNPQQLELKNLQYLMGILLFSAIPHNILLLGTGGGCLIHFLKYFFPDCHLTSVELDSELQALMHEKMLLPEASENLHYVIDDAVHYLQHCTQQFDLILVDIFDGNQSPNWLREPGNIRQMRALLSDQGAIGYNLLFDSEREFKLFQRNLTQVFAERYLILSAKGYDNTLAYGFRNQPPEHDMTFYMQQAVQMSELHNIDYNAVLAAIYTNNPVGSGII